MRASSAVLLVLASCVERADAPSPPNFSALAAIYDAPPGVLDPSTPDATLAAATAQLSVLEASQVDVWVPRIVDVVADAIDRASLTPKRQDVPLDIDGVAQLDVSCGEDSSDVAHLEATVARGELSSSIWGDARLCPFSWLGDLVDVDDPYEVWLAMERDDDTILVRLEASDVDQTLLTEVDFRVVDGEVEARVSTDSGDVIASEDGDLVELRTATGTALCDPYEVTCQME